MMSRRLDEDDESILPQREPRLRDSSLSAERELTLGTGAILGICFGLVLLCGAFFGFGYKLGSSAAKAAVAGSASDSADSPALASSSTNFGAFKPSAGSPAAAAPGATAASSAAAHGSDMPVMTTPPGASAGPTAPARSSTTAPYDSPANSATPGPVAGHTAPAPSSSAASTPAPMPPISPTGAFVVQVAAVSHTEDADLLVSALHAKGYTVAARTEPGDRLVHIQVGPFHDKKDADAMRQRLLSDGYNAFIK